MTALTPAEIAFLNRMAVHVAAELAKQYGIEPPAREGGGR